VPPSDIECVQCSQIESVPVGYSDKSTPLPSIQFCNIDAYAQNSKQDTDFFPDLGTDKVTSIGYYTVCCTVMQLISFLEMEAA